MSVGARLASVLVGVMLSGAPRVLAMNAPVERHRCDCPTRAGEHHECKCAICRKIALTVQAEDDDAPPCHRAAALKALAERAPRGSRGAPCVEGTCGGPGQPTVTPAGLEPFCLPLVRSVVRVERVEWRIEGADPNRDRSLAPTTPPPRAP